ncbi:MAG TPA: response regulator [Candidatus Limnocylindria bacterium]
MNQGGTRVLVVEDDPALRDIYSNALSEFGHEVRAARDGADALQVLATGFQPCVVFLDLRMPGMNGWEFMRRLREDPKWEDLPVVVVAAHFRIDDEAREVGAAAWLQKPFDLNRLDQHARAYCAC